MAKLSEASQWEPEIYQLETSDPVEGGPDGIDNVQARQLGNRTRYLKDQHDVHLAADNPHPQYATILQMKAAIDALVASAPGALDTLKELADALGDDPNFATTMTNALALKAALDSPNFGGTPKGPTPTQFDSSQRLATTAFVRSVGMQASAFTTVVGATTLTAEHAGSTIYLGGTGNYVVTLPRASTLPPGARIEFVSGIGVSPVTISRQGTDAIYMNANVSVSAVPMALGDTYALETNGANWYSVGGSTPLAYTNGFSASLNTSGYQKLPSGLIEQWGTGSSDANGNMVMTNPITFQRAILGGIANEASPGGWGTNTTTVWSFDMGSSTLSTSFARVRNITSAGGPAPAAGVAGRIRVWGY
ncbi:TPA: hypothetical protein QDB07_000131 [Burkholderia vietnamiensis]|nr:hypothetical protein [Burkholderia vietnamiensis]